MIWRRRPLGLDSYIVLQHETLIQLPSRMHSLRNSRRAIVYSLEDQSLTGELLMCVGRAGREARREFDQNIFPSITGLARWFLPCSLVTEIMVAAHCSRTGRAGSVSPTVTAGLSLPGLGSAADTHWVQGWPGQLCTPG